MISFTKKLSTKFHFLVNKWKIFEILMQAPCLLCGGITLDKSKYCAACLKDLPWNQHFCQQCSLPMESQAAVSLVCGDCLTTPPPFSKTIAPFIYSFPINIIIHKVKYGKEQFWLKSLSIQFNAYLNEHHRSNPVPDTLIPVPLHNAKLSVRTFNQAEVFARHLSAQLGIPANSKVLLKTRESSDQASLNKKQRLNNLKGCFCISNTQAIQGKHLILIDDVITTKATSEVCSDLLLRGGAKRVDVWCLARTPKLSVLE